MPSETTNPAGAGPAPGMGERWRVETNDAGEVAVATVRWISTDARVIEGETAKGQRVRRGRSCWLGRAS